jgi:Zn-finger nucleic acid-binding protein
MKCPHCDVTLHMTDRQGVEIDFCPECRGVWLDRGELDKILERSHAELTAVAAAPPPPDRGSRGRDERRDDRYDARYQDPKYQKKKKRTSFLEDLFEFGG